jgi:hypothetical protein
VHAKYKGEMICGFEIEFDVVQCVAMRKMKVVINNMTTASFNDNSVHLFQDA